MDSTIVWGIVAFAVAQIFNILERFVEAAVRRYNAQTEVTWVRPEDRQVHQLEL